MVSPKLSAARMAALYFAALLVANSN